MSWGSSVPSAIGALVTLAQGTTALSQVEICDGPLTVSAAHQAGVLTIGYPGGDDDTAAEVEAATADWSGQSDRESFTIACAASVSGASNDLAVTRTSAYGIVNALAGALATDPTLGGAVMRARISSSTLHQSQTKRGAAVTVSFTVAVDAFTQH